MRIDVTSALREPGSYFPFHVQDDRTLIETAADALRVLQPIQLQGTFVFSGDYLVLNGTLTAALEAQCGRCLAKFVLDISQPVDEAFSDDGADMNLSPDATAWPLNGATIDLEPIIESNLRLPLPMQYVCRPDCQGLCPHCFQNRNEHSCDCETQTDPANPFAALRQLINIEANEEDTHS